MYALLAAVLLATSSPQLCGRIMDEHGEPIADATVYLYTAAMKTGTSALCPSCYADCGKTALTAIDGTFTIESLDPELIFKVLVVAEGYQPVFVEQVDPLAGPIEAKLSRYPQGIAPRRLLKGRVVGPGGEPIVGAMVSPFGARDDQRRWWGPVPADALAISNQRGEFMLVCEKPGLELDVKVTARGLATRKFARLETGQYVHKLQLTDGAMVSGRLMVDDKPLAGVAIGLVQADRGPANFVGKYEIGTDAQGRFMFSNVAPDQSYFIYSMMNSLGPRRTVAIQSIQAGADGTVTDASTIQVVPAYRVSGRLVLSDGHPVPAGTRVLISRKDAWDSQTQEVDAEGRFVFDGVPPEVLSLTTRVKGYHLSSSNGSYESLNGRLMGRVDADIEDLHIVLDPGDQRPDQDFDHEQWKQLLSTRLRGAETLPPQ